MSDNKRVRFEMFRGTLASWNTLFSKAAQFANSLEQGSLINISHAVSHGDGVVAVWYWE